MGSCLFGIYFHYFFDNYWNEVNLFRSVLIFLWVTFIWDLYLSIRQYRVYLSITTVPVELAGVLDQKTLSKARLYNIDKSKFGFVSAIWDQCLSTVVLLTNVIPYLWYLSGETLLYVGIDKQSEVIRTVVFVIIASLISTVLDTPWSLYNTFVIEEKHGFNKQTLGFYVKDKLKKLAVSQVLSSIVIAVATFIIKAGGQYFFVYLWMFCSLVVFLFMTIYADYIAPLFDKFVPLPDGELRTKIEALASSLQFPLKKLYIVEGSKRSSHSNAYLYGFHKNKRIVIFDTLIEGYISSEQKDANDEADEKPDSENESSKPKKQGCNNNEILSILAHELGHWKLNHVLKNIVIMEVNMFFSFMAFGLLYQNPVVYSAFGFSNEKPVFVGLVIIFQYIFSPYNEVLNFLMTCLSRRFEFAADAFAKQLNKASDLRSALIKLNTDNLGFPIYDWLYSSWHHSHPPLLQRLHALGKID